MTRATPKQADEARWTRVLRGVETLAEDLGSLGAWVGPRTGPYKRSHGEKEDYVLRRLLVAWKASGALRTPFEIRAGTERPGEPDFVLAWPDGTTLGIEVTEAGEEDYQAWLTRTDRDRHIPSGVVEVPFDASTPRTAEEIRDAIARKVGKFERGDYRGPSKCDLLVYDNTSWGGFLDKGEILAVLGRPNDLVARFRQVHIVFGETVYLDVFGSVSRSVDVSGEYEIDYAKWIFDQVERLRHDGGSEVDRIHIAEELEDLGRSERRALASHLRNLVLHLLKWQYQAERRSESWRLSINGARDELSDLLTENPSLRAELESQIAKQYPRARRSVIMETELPSDRLPAECPYAPAELVDPLFFPEAEL